MNTIIQQKKILIAPLDWGLGHATRCISIIRYLQKLNCEITVAASGKTKHLLQNEFPNLTFIHLPGYNISYSKFKRWLPFKILLQVPKILKTIGHESKWLNEIVKTHKFDAVISDNRFGLYTKEIQSVFITHQLLVKTNFFLFDKIIQHLNYKFINRFSECWIPDFEGSQNISGELSHSKKLPATPVKYIGPLSRFVKSSNQQIKYKWIIIISGPEPQRSIFEKKMFELASKTTDNFFIVRGKPGEDKHELNSSNCSLFNHLNTVDMQAAIESSEFVISRCGYTTVMEILSLQKKSVFIPTPGQTEQEYLAMHLSKQNWAYTFNQEDDFLFHLHNAKKFNYRLPEINTELYKQALETFVSTLK